jgi:phage shock protein PspC (stress-responsive transcriptional regulator)
MNKVITINLNGRAYQLEENGYEALRAYLDNASASLEGDEGKSEIIADLEQAIAEKCDKVLNPHKTVVSDDEIKKIIDEMGPVEGAKTEGSKTNDTFHANAHNAPKRLYLIREGAVLAGVCTGLAAYFNVEVTVIRVIFIALTVFTGGAGILFYIALGLFVPYADTAEARAQAHGEPFNAEALVQRAKERWGESYERVTGNKWDDMTKGWETSHEQHLKWRQMRKQQKQEWKQQWRAQRSQWNPAYGMLRAIIALLWIGALLSLIRHGAIFGWTVTGIPIWLTMIFLFVVFFVVTGPLQAAQYGTYGMNDPMGKYYYHYHNDPWDGFVGVLTAIFVFIAFGWAYLHVPYVYELVHHPLLETKAAIAQIQTWWSMR